MPRCLRDLCRMAPGDSACRAVRGSRPERYFVQICCVTACGRQAPHSLLVTPDFDCRDHQDHSERRHENGGRYECEKTCAHECTCNVTDDHRGSKRRMSPQNTEALLAAVPGQPTSTVGRLIASERLPASRTSTPNSSTSVGIKNSPPTTPSKDATTPIAKPATIPDVSRTIPWAIGCARSAES